MDRKTLEKRLVRKINAKANVLGFELISEDYSSKFNHIVLFSLNTGNANFRIRLRFVKPNYLKLQVQFLGYNEAINNVVKEVTGLVPEPGPSVINFDMDDYFSRISEIQHQQFYIDDNGDLKNLDVEGIALRIFDRYFSFAKKELIPKLDSVEKLDSIISDPENFQHDDVKLSKFTFPRQNQILCGVILALVCKHDDYKNLLRKYLDFCLNRYGMGKDEYIDLAISIIKKYEPAMMA